MILLDTNALIWLHQGHARGRPLAERGARLYASPVSLLELQFLVECGRLRLRSGASVAALMTDVRWLIDDPPSGAWFEEAVGVGWTRDPFDRLIVAHARLRRWRVATGDAIMARHLGPLEQVAL